MKERLQRYIEQRGYTCTHGHDMVRFGQVCSDARVRCRECHRLACAEYNKRRKMTRQQRQEYAEKRTYERLRDKYEETT